MKKPAANRYLVVARRYRPQDFESLIGQGPLVQTLRNAIDADRVGHAYLFAGSRGVGKTSAARIFAKALNCQQGPTIHPCNGCESCLAIASGDDVDVLEIDGASNRGIDEIRQLRANVGFRPSRSRYKVYIIDEVHMLSRDAFNALLKTLEEPPPHVKFIFCTTDADKIPVTVLSRCQRFDFAPIPTSAIFQRLTEVVAAENAQAEPEALELLARRAEGSLRDSQSLLEQVLASAEGTITLEAVHQLLGTAPQQHVTSVMEALLLRAPQTALEAVDAAVRRGIDVGQFCEQLLTMLRDTMVIGVGCGSDSLQSAHAEQTETLRTWAQQWGIPALLNALQILEQTLARMRGSVHRRALLEIALVQIANLESLSEVAELARQAGARQPGPEPSPGAAGDANPSLPPAKKKEVPITVTPSDEIPDPVSPSPAAPSNSAATAASSTADCQDPTDLWRRVVEAVPGVVRTLASRFQTVSLDEPGSLVVTFESDFSLQQCQRPERHAMLHETLNRIAAVPLQLELRGPVRPTTAQAHTPGMSAREREHECLNHPLVQEALELFEADVTGVQTRPLR